MFWAAFLLGFFGFLRSGEFTVPNDSSFDPGCQLTPQDVAVDCRQCPRMVRVFLKQSKTDPFRKGVTIFLGRSNSALCPVSAILSYLAIRGSNNGPVFQFANGHPLTRQRLIHHLHEVLAAGIGAAKTAAARGIEDSLVKTLGRWEWAAYQRYVKLPRERLAEVSAILGRPTSCSGP